MSIDIEDLPQLNDLSGKSLTTNVKKRLIEEINEQGSNYFIVMNKYRMKYNTLRKYNKRIKKNLPTFEYGGRPSKLDVESQMEILRYMHNNSGFTTENILNLVKEEVIQTLQRRYTNGIPENISQTICRNSASNWVKRLIKLHEEDILGRVKD